MLKLTKLLVALCVFSGLLAGCTSNQSTEEQVKVFQSVNECLATGDFNEEICQSAYQSAEQDAAQYGQRYFSAEECFTEFGYNQCEVRSGGLYGPIMAGFIVSELIDEAFDYNRRRSYPVYRYRNGGSDEWLFGDGTYIGPYGYGRYSASPSTTAKTSSIGKVQKKSAVVRTVSKGGFGSTSSAKAGFSSSKSGGWGG